MPGGAPGCIRGDRFGAATDGGRYGLWLKLPYGVYSGGYPG